MAYEPTLPRDAARNLRTSATEAEQKLWSQLRKGQLDGFQFRRQYSIGPFFVDFICLEAMLVVEVDGSTHGQDDLHVRDERRTRWLEAHGCRVIRFWNRDVFRYPNEVIDILYGVLTQDPPSVAALARASARHLPPQGGKGKI